MNGTLPQPVRVNVINTDGQRYVIGCVQINSTDLGSETRCVDWPVLLNQINYSYLLLENRDYFDFLFDSCNGLFMLGVQDFV